MIPQHALQLIASVAFDEDTVAAVESGVCFDGSSPSGLSIDEAMGYAVDALRDIRTILKEAGHAPL